MRTSILSIDVQLIGLVLMLLNKLKTYGADEQFLNSPVNYHSSNIISIP
jgi:hypothetical protein